MIDYSMNAITAIKKYNNLYFMFDIISVCYIAPPPATLHH